MKKNAYLVLIISCWVLLALALIVKLFFNHYFEITLNNETIINAGAYIDKHLWLKLLMVTIIYIPASYLLYLAMVKKKIGQDWWVCFIWALIPTIKNYIVWLGTALEMSLLILLPLFRCKFKNWLLVLIGNIAIVAYELTMLFIRNLGLYLSSDNVLIGLVMNLDYYIMIILFYLYVNYNKLKKKEVS